MPIRRLFPALAGPLLAGLAALLAACGLAAAKTKPLKARFLGDATYTLDGGCDKLKALAAGTQRSLNTVPETLSATGFDGWEGGCSFASITEVKKGTLYKARLSCGESAEEWVETDTFALSDGGATVTVTVLGKDKKTSVFKRCDVPAKPGKT